MSQNHTNQSEDTKPFEPEELAAALAAEEPSPEELLAAKTRTAAALAAAARAHADVPGPIGGCADFAALVPAYLAGALPEPRRVLVQDHVRSCVSCRRLVMARGNLAAPAVPVREARSPWPWLAAAASVALALGGGVFALRRAAPVASASTVERLDGTLIAPARNALVKAGERAEGAVRTGRASRAMLRLSDGSRVEMGERSELYVTAAPAGLTVHLGRGRVLVQAAKQAKGRHLAVTTPDCAVSVVGTVFAVNHGMSGSRVSVLEGEVRVTAGNRTRALKPGEQAASRAGIPPVPIAEEVAFSSESERWEKLAAELAGLQSDLAKAFPTPGLQHDTRLLDVAPAGTVVYGAIPNLSGGLREAWRVLEERVAQGGALSKALAPALSSERSRAHIDEAVEILSDVGERIGDEIALAVVADGTGKVIGPVIYAEARRPQELRERLAQVVSRINGEAGKDVLRLVESPAALAAPHQGGTLLLAGPFVAVGFQPEPLLAFASAASGGGTMAGSPIAESVAAAYRQGLHDVLAADLTRLFHGGKGSGPDAALERLGILDARGLLVARRVEGETARTEASLTFGQTRRGMAAWLAAPAPLGALDYVSSQATVAAAFAIKEPRAILQELTGLDPKLAAEVAKAGAELGFSIEDDLAASLGGDFAVAVDGPLLPKPALKLVVEVYDPERLEMAFERLVRKLDTEARAKGEAGFELVGTQVGGRTYQSLGRTGSDPMLHFTYDNGYLVAGTDRTVVSRALETRAAGTSLRATGRLQELLPGDGPLEVSALVYQNLGTALHASTPPSLGWARGEDDRIVMGYSGPAGFAGFDLSAVMAKVAEAR